MTVFYNETKAYYILKSFAKDVRKKLDETVTTGGSSHVKDLTLFQIVPPELHSTYFFKVFQNLTKSAKIASHYTTEKIKAVLFMVFHIEGNSRWAHKFNNQMLKCHEKIENYQRGNYLSEEE
jgi:hypothetical protein